MGVDDESPVRLKNAVDVGQKPPAMGAAVDHAKRTEKAHAIIGRVVRDGVQFHEIHLQTVERKTLAAGPLAHETQHVARKIDGHATHPPANQRCEGPTCSAAQIDDQSGGLKEFFDNFLIQLKERVVFEKVVVLLGDLPTLTIVPQASLDPDGQPPSGSWGGRQWRRLSLNRRGTGLVAGDRRGHYNFQLDLEILTRTIETVRGVGRI